MAKTKNLQLGFELPKAIESLRLAAVEAGAFPPGDPRAATPYMVANAHTHGIESDRRCANNPCRLAALCLALYEIIQYQEEAGAMNPLLEAAKQVEAAARFVERAREQLVHGAKAIRANMSALEAREGRQTRRLREANALVTRLASLRSGVDGLASGLRSNAWGAQHQQSSTRKGSDLLLTAVWQHLDWGGLTYEEMFDLVPSTGTVTKAKDVVRKRVARPNARSMLPRELHPELREGPKVEKRHRRRSSTRQPA